MAAVREKPSCQTLSTLYLPSDNICGQWEDLPLPLLLCCLAGDCVDVPHQRSPAGSLLPGLHYSLQEQQVGDRLSELCPPSWTFRNSCGPLFQWLLFLVTQDVN